MKKTYLLFLCLFCISVFTYSADEEKDSAINYTLAEQSIDQSTTSKSGFDKSKLSLGGNFGLQFTNGHTLIGIMPQVGYNVSPLATLGAGVGYMYHRNVFYNPSKNDFRSSYFGFNLFSRLYPVKNIVLSVQPEIGRVWTSYRFNNTKVSSDNTLVPIFLIGGGLRLGNAIAMIQYDLVQNRNTPYGNTIFYTFGYNFNF